MCMHIERGFGIPWMFFISCYLPSYFFFFEPSASSLALLLLLLASSSLRLALGETPSPCVSLTRALLLLLLASSSLRLALGETPSPCVSLTRNKNSPFVLMHQKRPWRLALGENSPFVYSCTKNALGVSPSARTALSFTCNKNSPFVHTYQKQPFRSHVPIDTLCLAYKGGQPLFSLVTSL